MNNELLLLNKKHTDTLIEKTKTKPQETLEFKMNKQMETFSFNPPIKLVVEGKWLLAVGSFECTDYVFDIANENNSFSITTPGQWNSELAEKNVEKLKELLELDKNDLSLHIAAVREKGRKIYLVEDEYDLSDLDISLLRNEIFEKLKKINILTTTKFLQTWKIVQDASMSTSLKIHEDPTSISLKAHNVDLLVLPINHPTNIDILKIWFIDYK